jgi:hypothetical protein
VIRSEPGASRGPCALDRDRPRHKFRSDPDDEHVLSALVVAEWYLEHVGQPVCEIEAGGQVVRDMGERLGLDADNGPVAVRDAQQHQSAVTI